MNERHDEACNFRYEVYENEYSPAIAPHFHNCYEILFFETGDAFYNVEGNIYELTHGDILITNPREMHCPVFKSNKKYKRSLIFLKPSYLSEFITDKYNPFLALDKRKVATQNRIDTKIVKKFELDKKMNLIGEYFLSDMPEKDIMIKALLIEFLVSLNKIVSINEEVSNSHKITGVVQYINDNIAENITLESLSKKFFLNKYYIAHEFKEKTGFSIMDYIAHKRITLSKELILSELPLSDIAISVGFNDYSGFYRAFTKIVGISPLKYKKSSQSID